MVPKITESVNVNIPNGMSMSPIITVKFWILHVFLPLGSKMHNIFIWFILKIPFNIYEH